MKRLFILMSVLLLSSCSTAPKQADPFDLALSASMLAILTGQDEINQQEGGVEK